MKTVHQEEKHDALEAFKPYEHFCKCMLDAYVILNMDGKVVRSNQIFSLVIGKKSKQILKSENLQDLIRFEVDSRQLQTTEILSHSNPHRFDEVKGITDFNSNMNLILGLYPLFNGEEKVGAFLLIRDVTAETALQDKYKVKSAQSITDVLTGLYNRSYFEQYLPEAVRTYKERTIEDQNLSIIMADVDHFKRVNDTYGHQGGDYVLEHLAKIFKKNFRKTDVVCRYGGEEFLMILPSTNLEEACIAAFKIKLAIENEIFSFQNTRVPVTISMGVAQIKLGEETSNQALARADAALYAAKEKGRNRVCRSSEVALIEEFTTSILI